MKKLSRFQWELIEGRHTLGQQTWTSAMRRFGGSYNRSVKALLQMLDEEHIPYEILPGERGGWYGARLWVEPTDRKKLI